MAYLILYYSLLFISLLLCLRALKYDQKFLSILFLLIFSIITEAGMGVLRYYGMNYYPLYHLFTPIEYALISLYLSKEVNLVKARKLILISIPGFTFLSFFLSFFIVDFYEYPGLQYNIEGVLVLLFSITTLFAFRSAENRSVASESTFWIVSGFVIFYTGIFFVNGFFNYFFKNKNGYLENIHTIINTTFNYVLYLFMIIGFLCPRKKVKFS